MPEYKTPGVYVEEIPKLPPSIASVETAIPAFIGFTEKAQWKEPKDLENKPKRIKSMLEYEQYFGFADPEKDSVSIVFGGSEAIGKVDETKRSKFLMYYSLQLFFLNGGGPCWIVSVGAYDAGVDPAKLLKGLNETAKINEVTLLLFPDACMLDDAAAYYELHIQALRQAADLKDRFVILDIFRDPNNLDVWSLDIDTFRNRIGTENLKYGAVYFPFLRTRITISANESLVKVDGAVAPTLDGLKAQNDDLYFKAKRALANTPLVLPPSSAMAGIYAQVDSSRGVWKAPANINISTVDGPLFRITNREQDDLNVDPNFGKSVNAIREFEGRGPAIVWGARTMAGNDNEWRYISVRRFFNMVEESVKNATQQFVFEPNDENTWVRVKSMIQNYLTQQWRFGALMGASVKEAFYVHVGLGETMTELDIWEGRLIIEIGMAVVRPAEFIILKFMHKMLQES